MAPRHSTSPRLLDAVVAHVETAGRTPKGRAEMARWASTDARLAAFGAAGAVADAIRRSTPAKRVWDP